MQIWGIQLRQAPRAQKTAFFGSKKWRRLNERTRVCLKIYIYPHPRPPDFPGGVVSRSWGTRGRVPPRDTGLAAKFTPRTWAGDPRNPLPGLVSREVPRGTENLTTFFSPPSIFYPPDPNPRTPPETTFFDPPRIFGFFEFSGNVSFLCFFENLLILVILDIC